MVPYFLEKVATQAVCYYNEVWYILGWPASQKDTTINPMTEFILRVVSALVAIFLLWETVVPVVGGLFFRLGIFQRLFPTYPLKPAIVKVLKMLL